ncbi:MAG: UDP-N-acetylmuramoyl-tripeptide--D-alanyl-D-alanine ligase [Candidatus Omnitrophica bacterium]|nr:UDP-N-acetylmuramoyl-tripeptide--D-alanyl-D-alanine ligase [Candidatus Omnitrophota bacterium]MBI2174712.1 UDP-N-acetylmuramoyl-tripeptide--D-alanyl-D-alanine ligase [Candidatus Omnitrophota bacterium]MBI3010269.1 UDP-N-acetylmuramoyl-tripeptide--D-alanyl-D-alanine ligase [Candidatus Omnitrophota bacterium]
MWSIDALLEATQGELAYGSAHGQVESISIDSRELQPGEAFIAIRGERFDGHQFLSEAVRRGASCLVVSRWPLPVAGEKSLPSVIVVDETSKALGDIARFHRRRMDRPVIAVTGSCGKTTTKELIAHLLGSPETVLKTTGTQNNHIGVPLTLLRLRPEHEAAVIEMGSNHPGEIAYLASIAEPQMAVLTNVGPVHLEFFGSLLGVLYEKLSLFQAIPADGSVVLPGDQLDVCLEAPRYIGSGVRRVLFGTSDRCDLQALEIQRLSLGMQLRLRDHYQSWNVPLAGYHNVENALAAIACAWTMGVPLSVAKEKLAYFESIPLRSEILHCGGLTILNDCYNANPLSSARALETLRELGVRRRVAVLGDMLELGEFAEAAHQAIGRLCAQLEIDVVLAVGSYAEHIATGVREKRANGVSTYGTVEALLKRLPGLLQSGDGLLVKGSRRLRLEQVTQFLLESGEYLKA